MYALIDCNNFFVSCERVFNPKLRSLPVIVLSNNDGCAIARSNEVKKLGVLMGTPFFKIRDLVFKHKVVVLSSNFDVYGNLSSRIMNIIRSYSPKTEVYSVDEAFINLAGVNNKLKFCISLAKKIEQYTGIPVSIGIAKTKTLAKVANHIAKKNAVPHRVFFMENLSTLQKILVGDVWGIGRRLEKRLQALGIYTASDLIQIPDADITRLFNVVVLRTVRELRGISSIELQDRTINKGQIMVSRSFGHRITELSPIQEALATHASVACTKLRKQNLVAGGISVFLNTGLHGQEVYKNSFYLELPSVTSDTRIVIKNAKKILQMLFIPGYQYKKVGIILTDLSSIDQIQFDLFEHNNIQSGEKLMNTIDYINRILGRNTLQFASAGLQKEWQMKSEKRTKNYTGNWEELPTARIKLL